LELSRKLAPAIGYTSAIDVTCSRICRAAATLQRLAEEECNGHPAQGYAHSTPEAWARVERLQTKWEERIERETEQVTRRFHSLVADLPHTDCGPFKGEPVGDPRGCSLLIVPEDCGISGDSWGDRNGVCIP
jgi:hypothetical protein